MAIIGGVEEAGRGPVIGPMVMAIVTIDEADELRLSDLGVKDSKLLTPEKREELYDIILMNVKNYKIISISPSEIDEALDKNNVDMNLNWLEAKTSVQLINAVELEKVILDCPSNNIPAYTHYVENLLERKKDGMKVDVIAEHKADVNYPIVGAASILAKVTRDRMIQVIKEKYKINFGSGYPSDPRTITFLHENYNKYPIFRKTWSSYKRVKAAHDKDQTKLGDF